MPTVLAERVEVNLTLEQIATLLQQLRPQEREWVWRAAPPCPWQERVAALLIRVGQRVERDPITEEEIAAEVEQARAERYA